MDYDCSRGASHSMVSYLVNVFVGNGVALCFLKCILSIKNYIKFLLAFCILFLSFYPQGWLLKVYWKGNSRVLAMCGVLVSSCGKCFHTVNTPGLCLIQRRYGFNPLDLRCLLPRSSLVYYLFPSQC